ncbi:MAG: efflux RND transporter permease subunit [Thiotrichales bacterium]
MNRAPDSAERQGRFNLSEIVLRHRQVAWFFVLVVGFGGILAYFALGQREDPDFTFRAMVIRTLWPGATTEQISQLVTERIVKELQEVPYYKYTNAYSKPGESLVILELIDSSPAKEVREIWYQVRKKVGDIRHSLPREVIGPFFDDEFGDVFGSIFAFTAVGLSHSELRDHVERVKLEVLRLPDVAKVDLVGVQDDRVYVEISHHALAMLGVTAATVAGAIQAHNSVIEAGRVETQTHSVALRVSGQFESLEALRALPLRLGDRSVRLGDIAEVSRGYLDPPVTTMRYRGESAIGLAVAMVGNGDVIKLGENLQALMARLRTELPPGIAITQVSDQPQIVREAINDFMKVLLEAVVIVLAVSFVSLGLRTGLVVAVTIPLVLAGTFLMMRLFSIDMHRISAGALIIALGLLVDDAMIAVEMMARKLEEGWDKLRAATYAYRSTAFPMLTGTLVTVAGFLPIGTAKSSTGEYTFAMFSVVTIALIVSWIAAVIVTPLVGSVVLKPHRHGGAPGAAQDLFDTRFYRALRRVIEFCLRYRWLVIAATIGLFALGIVGMGLTNKQFFPSSNRTELMVELWLAEGAGIRATEHEAARFEALLADDEDVKTFATYVGYGSPRFFLSLDQQLFRPNFAHVVVLTHDIAARERVLERVRQLFAQDFPAVRGRVMRVPLGPPVNYPVQFRVIGDDPQRLKRIAEEVAQIMRASPHTLNVNADWGERAPALQVRVDQDQAAALGVSTVTISHTLHGVLNGLPLGQFRERDRLIDIVLRAPEHERNLLAAIDAVNVPTASGAAVPLAQVARVETVFEEPILWQRDRRPTLTVRADLIDGVQAPDVTMALDPLLDPVRAQLPPGYRIEPGGAFEENKRAEAAIAAGMPLMLAVVAALLMLQLQSFSRVFMVLLTAPLGVIGVALGLLVFNQPFGFVALLGTIALSGMIMRNTVILVDQIRQDMDDGRPMWEAIRESTVRRFRPIVLTAAASILAMIPLSTNVLWGPMAFAIMGGLTVATLLTILFVPALYAAWFRVRPA